MKKRAPRNRTLTLTPAETKRLGRQLAPLPAKPLSLKALKNQIFQADTLNLIPLLPDQCIDLLIVDPPYNLSKDYGKVKFTARSEESYESWFESWFSPLLGKLKPTASVYLCCDWQSSVVVQRVLARHLHIRNRITWEREKGRGSKDNWKNSSEDIWYATVSDKDFTFHTDAVKLRRKVIAPYVDKKGDPKDWEKTLQGNFRLTHPSNLWTDISIPFWSMPENTDHPTQKPEKLLAKLILASSNEGDLVFDPFLGSGTTAVVAKKLGRDFCGVEINPEYGAWALKRLEKAGTELTIQGLHDGVFWERNSAP